MTPAVEEIATDHHSPAMGAGMFGRARAPAAPPTAQIIALPDLHPEMVDAAAPAIVQDWNPLHHIKATLQVCVGEASITVGELLAAKEHQVLRLDRTMDQPVDLTIEGRVVARGELVAVDGYFAVRITELPTALGLTNGG